MKSRVAPPHSEDFSQEDLDPPLDSRAVSWLQVAWPSFLIAGALEGVVFSVVDPGGLTGFGGAPLDWAPQAVYTLSFFMFWGAIASSCAITRALTPSHGAPHSEDATKPD